ncbi:MAG TPA: hypothetical protein PL166_05525, partial [Candidatus Contendobacter sp.]|nr:hypothetical protein [Candidatus Contendobacter sp.]HRD49052.1 hypothetical protein [Candidatus Contendobacter sp.]
IEHRVLLNHYFLQDYPKFLPYPFALNPSPSSGPTLSKGYSYAILAAVAKRFGMTLASHS